MEASSCFRGHPAGLSGRASPSSNSWKRSTTRTPLGKWFEIRVWPEGRHCPRCGSTDTHEGSETSGQPYRCRDCRRTFSVRTGTALERSMVPLRRWTLAVYLTTTSEMGFVGMLTMAVAGFACGVRLAGYSRRRRAYGNARGGSNAGLGGLGGSGSGMSGIAGYMQPMEEGWKRKDGSET